jgi:tetratricopeptide (TPR) repeat protein
VQASPAGSRIRAFVGRTREIAALGSALDAANGGRGTLCLISGEPGIGKSRLLVEFAAEQASRYPSIHWGFAWEAGGAPVYWPWIQILRSLLSRDYARATLHEQPHLAAAIGELVPELVPSAARNGARLEPEQARFRLMDAVSSLLLTCAAHEPLVLVLEDLHAVDTDSLSLLEFAARQLHGARASIIGTFRDAEIHRPRIGNIVARLRRAAIQLPLRRLDRDEIREYVRVATGERPLEQDVTGLATLTEGHPLYLAEVVELGLERGNLLIAPPSIRVTILERASQLPQQSRTLLGMASVLGRGFQPAALSEISGLSEPDLQESLAPALASGLLEKDAGAGLRFEHMLVREAFHDALPVTERRMLHEREAQRMRSRAEQGATVSWAALAQHFEESREKAGAEAVDAWSKAAHQAEARHSFDDAALCYNRALLILGDTSAMDVTRARLMLELAAAQIRAGDLDAGRRNSAEAFRIGESLDDADLLADAALTYGSIFTFGSVDPRLVGLLKTALTRVHESDTDRRARLQARLAAAMQPAADPSEPVALAHDAIRLARSAGHARTLLTTLRSAVSALMDLGDPVERLALNQEYVGLARQLGDAPECMRGFMRSSVDAMELGEAVTLDEAITQCDALAEQLAMPHYQWTAAAMRVMRATSRGEFAAAEAALARARRLADRAQDTNASLTLLVQQFALAEMKEDQAQLASLCARLERQCAKLPHSDMYLKPALLAAATRSLGRKLDPADLDETCLRSIIRFCDMGAFASLGDCLVAIGNRSLIDFAYESILPYKERCGHWGLLGLRWFGPVARSLGLLAAAQGRIEAANEHFAAAVEIARRMDARPWMARIVLEWIESLRPNGQVPQRALQLLDEAQTTASELGLKGLEESLARCRGSAATQEPAAPMAAPAGLPEVEYFRVSPDGEVWVCECDGRTFRLRDSRGMQMLARLIAVPGREIHVLDLMGAANADQPVDSGDCGEALDDRGRREYRRRLESLRAQLEEAESHHDLAGAEAAREEIEQLSAELSRAFGLGGRARRTGSNVERARVNVQRRLKHALDRIAQECPEAGKHLNWAVRTGSFCSYQPR